jgi:transcriptional regulator with XRE-family HTH domain
MTLTDFGRALTRPDGRYFSAGWVSRLERGRSAAPLYVYLAIADLLEVDPGVLLGPEAAALDVTDGEAVLLQYLRGAGIEPSEAILRLSGCGSP